MIRKPAVSGIFYPSRKDELKAMVSSMIKNADRKNISGNLKALIVPHAGYVYSGIVAAHGYKLVNSSCRKVFIIGPSHHLYFDGAAFDSADFWETPIGKVKLLKEKSNNIIKTIPDAHVNEHSIEVQLPFLQMVLKNFAILPIATSNVPYSIIADYVDSLLDENTLLVVSSDLSHFYDYNKALKIDSYANEFIPKLMLQDVEGKVEACGKTGILAAMKIAKKNNWSCSPVKYMNSGDTSGDKKNVVGYGCYAFYR